MWRENVTKFQKLTFGFDLILVSVSKMLNKFEIKKSN